MKEKQVAACHNQLVTLLTVQRDNMLLYLHQCKNRLRYYTDMYLASQIEPGICLTTICLQSQMYLESVVAPGVSEENTSNGQFAPKWKLKPFISRGLCRYRLR